MKTKPFLITSRFIYESVFLLFPVLSPIAQTSFHGAEVLEIGGVGEARFSEGKSSKVFLFVVVPLFVGNF